MSKSAHILRDIFKTQIWVQVYYADLIVSKNIDKIIGSPTMMKINTAIIKMF